jgi:hypothetical protein
LSAAVLSIQANSVFHTSAATYIKVAAEKTPVTEILLLAGKGPLFTANCEFLQRRFKNVAQLPLRLDKKLTAKGIAAVLDNNKTRALLTVCANCVFT